MKKLEFRDKVFKEIFDVIYKDSKKMDFTRLEVNKRANSFYIKYSYPNSRSILIIIKNTALIEFYYRLRYEVDTVNVVYSTNEINPVENIDNKFFEKLQKDFKDIIKSITK